MKHVFSWCCILSFYSSAVLSAASEDYLYNMPLEDLARVKVSVSSHRPEAIKETPAIITRYNMADMAAFGLHTLKDVISFIPGLTIQEHLFGQPFVAMRGVYEGFNQKVLFLLDDTPYFMSSHSDVPILGIPVDAISHIEVIRGPGAVYYGTNATGGVIKVITKKQADNRVSVRVGENRYANFSGMFTHEINGHQFSLATELQHDDGYQATYPLYLGSSGVFTEGEIDKAENAKSLLFKYHYQNFNFTAQAHQVTYTGLAQPRTTDNINTLTYQGLLIAADQSWQLDKTSIKLFADFNRFYPKFEIENISVDGDVGGFQMANEGDENYRARAGLQATVTISPRWEVFSGVEYERRSTEEYQVINYSRNEVTGSIWPHFHLNETSLYSQVDYRPVDDWRLTLGGRYTHNSITGHDVVPRVALIYQLTEKSAVKVLYSVGFNSPSLNQLKADFSDIVIGNPDLQPEKVRTLDVSYSYTDTDLVLEANIFRLDAQDFILSDRTQGTIHFFNASSFTRYGGELSVQYQLQNGLKILSNLSYHQNGSEYNNEDVSLRYTPEFTFNLGGTYQLNAKQRIGSSLRYISTRAAADELWLWNLDYRYQLEQVSLTATFENLLDTEILHPNMAEYNERLIPGGQGRNIKFMLRYNF